MRKVVVLEHISLDGVIVVNYERAAQSPPEVDESSRRAGHLKAGPGRHISFSQGPVLFHWPEPICSIHPQGGN